MSKYVSDMTEQAALVFAEGFVEKVFEDLNDIKHSFFRIGFRLAEANSLHYYETLGYDSITELAEDKFGFKKTTTYNLMQVYEYASSHGKTNMVIAPEFVDYSYSQLREMSRSRWGGAHRLIKPKDTVEDIKHFITVWNKYGESCSGHDCETIQQYLDKLTRRGYLKPAPKAINVTEETPGLLQLGQVTEETESEPPEPDRALSEVTAEEEPAENSTYVKNQTDPAPTQVVHTQDEVIEYVLTERYAESKFRIYAKHQSGALRQELVDFVKSEYGNSGWNSFSDYYTYIECSPNRGMEITPRTGGKIILTWRVVTGRISRLIESGNYLTAEELRQYEELCKAEKSEEPEAEELPAGPEKNSTYVENCEKITTEKRTVRAQLAVMSDEQFVEALLMRIIRAYPLRGESADFVSKLRVKLAEWLSSEEELDEVTA